MSLINRKKTKKIMVGKVAVGGGAPISVQSMTNTSTEDIKATIAQIKRIEKVGADIIRVSCPTPESSIALKEITKEAAVPIVADIHFHYKIAILAAQNGASCLRINPGNIGSVTRVQDIIKAAKDYGCSIRVGINSGSLERDILSEYTEPNIDALFKSACRNIAIMEDNDFFNFKLSVKSSDVLTSIGVYEKLSDYCNYPLHLGITEAGSMRSGTVKSAMGIGSILLKGIGDTIRVSLSSEPETEIKVGFDILRALHLRNKGIDLISCPSCARQNFDVIRVSQKLEKALDEINSNLTISILGCVVNGIGEAKTSDIGIVGGGKDIFLLYIDGKQVRRCKKEDIVEVVLKEVKRKKNVS